MSAEFIIDIRGLDTGSAWRLLESVRGESPALEEILDRVPNSGDVIGLEEVFDILQQHRNSVIGELAGILDSGLLLAGHADAALDHSYEPVLRRP